MANGSSPRYRLTNLPAAPADKQDQQQSKPEERQISEEELRRILQALENDEKEVQKKINEQKVQVVPLTIEKDW